MGKAVLLLVVLLVAVGGGLVYNYQRNAYLEADLHKPRPYATIPTADLAKLIAAYEKEIGRSKSRVASAPTGEDAINRRDESDLGGRADAFANFQRNNEQWKAQRGQVIDKQVELDQLKFEKSIRDRHLDDPQYVLKARLLTF
jgi:hypothetical protein